MKFFEYRSGWDAFKRLTGNAFAARNDAEVAKILLEHGAFDNPFTYRHAKYTLEWRKLGSPYYDVYPGILKMLAGVSLEFPGTEVHPPAGLKHLLLRLPRDGHCLVDRGVDGRKMVVQTIMVSFQGVNRAAGGLLEDGLVVGFDVGETKDEMPVFTFRVFPLDERTVEESVDSLEKPPEFNGGWEIPTSLVVRCVKTAIAVCMLQDDPDILEPQMLARDEGKELTEELVDKARRRGKFAFFLGKGMEVIPHIRRPHPALVWTGKGRVVPRIVFRKGSIIHREVVEKIPTGKTGVNDGNHPEE